MTLDIRVDADEVTKALDQLDKKGSAKALKAAVRKAGNYLKPKVKSAAPKRTGALQKSVKVKVKKSRQSGDVFAVVAPFARHRHLVLQGTKDRFTRNGAFRGQMPANPFVDRVADAHEAQAIRVAEQELARQLDLD